MGTTAKTRNTVRLRSASLQSFNHDGLELARRRTHRRAFPLRQLALFGLAILAFKIFLYLDMGGAAYGAKVAELRAGEGIERLAGQAMALDPASKWLVTQLQFAWF